MGWKSCGWNRLVNLNLFNSSTLNSSTQLFNSQLLFINLNLFNSQLLSYVCQKFQNVPW